MDYVIVTGGCDGELEVKVRAKIKEGFEPCGGVVVTSKPGAFELWAQAMISKPNS